MSGSNTEADSNELAIVLGELMLDTRRWLRDTGKPISEAKIDLAVRLGWIKSTDPVDRQAAAVGELDDLLDFKVEPFLSTIQRLARIVSPNKPFSFELTDD